MKSFVLLISLVVITLSTYPARESAPNAVVHVECISTPVIRCR